VGGCSLGCSRGDALVAFDGTGLMIVGCFCAADPISYTCNTWAVRFDGVGLIPVNEVYYFGDYCLGGSFIDFDGTGLKIESYPNTPCD
jgi:hypothetical protein